jgi:hypothetical protein
VLAQQGETSTTKLPGMPILVGSPFPPRSPSLLMSRELKYSTPCLQPVVWPMNIDSVWIQADGAIPSNEAFYKAWEGFRKLRIPCHLFEVEDLEQRRIALTKRTLVAGAIRTVEKALIQLGVSIPVANHLPRNLASYLGRKIWRSTWGELRTQFSGQRFAPLFVKPADEHKAFPAMALYNQDDLESAHRLPNELAVLVAEYVVFASEWRCYVCRGEILEICHYNGDPFTFPDPRTIKKAITDLGREAIAGYGIDFGVLENGRTVLVEMNEGYSLGSYGLSAMDYAQLLEARWSELVG